MYKIVERLLEFYCIFIFWSFDLGQESLRFYCPRKLSFHLANINLCPTSESMTFRCVFPTITFYYESASSKRIFIFLTNKIDIYRYIYICIVRVCYSFTHDLRYIINFILSHYQAKSELSIDFLFIIEKRPFPAMTCRRTLEMEMKALLVSERIAQSSPRFLSSIRAARIIAASSMMFAMFELFSNYFPLMMGHDLDNAIYDRISLFFDSTSSLQIWSRKRGEGCV